MIHHHGSPKASTYGPIETTDSSSSWMCQTGGRPACPRQNGQLRKRGHFLDPLLSRISWGACHLLCNHCRFNGLCQHLQELAATRSCISCDKKKRGAVSFSRPTNGPCAARALLQSRVIDLRPKQSGIPVRISMFGLCSLAPATAGGQCQQVRVHLRHQPFFQGLPRPLGLSQPLGFSPITSSRLPRRPMLPGSLTSWVVRR